MTPEKHVIFDAENPYWANFFKDKRYTINDCIKSAIYIMFLVMSNILDPGFSQCCTLMPNLLHYINLEYMFR